jgi:hypothetical protein
MLNLLNRVMLGRPPSIQLLCQHLEAVTSLVQLRPEIVASRL